MDNQSLILLSLGVFVVLIVTAVAVTQDRIDKHPLTEVGGLIWNVEDKFDRIQDLEATLQVTDESQPGEYVRFRIRYIKTPTPVFSMRYVPPPDARGNVFLSPTDYETFTIKNDQLLHYIPSENVEISKRWAPIPLVDIGLDFFKLSQVEADWDKKVTDVRILQDPGFSEIPSATVLSLAIGSFTYIRTPFEHIPELAPHEAGEYALCFSFCPDLQAEDPTANVGFARSLSEYTGGTLQRSRILEIRDAQSKDLLRMIWINPETLLIQKIVTFKDGERSTTFLLQSVTIDQGLTESDVITHPPDDALKIRG